MKPEHHLSLSLVEAAALPPHEPLQLLVRKDLDHSLPLQAAFTGVGEEAGAWPVKVGKYTPSNLFSFCFTAITIGTGYG